MTTYSHSFRLGRILGIDVFIDATILIPLVMVALSGAKNGVNGIIIGLTIVAIVFTSVLLHEFGHALAARKCHIVTERITLGMLGGVAQLGSRVGPDGMPTRMPLTIKEDLFITIAGPAVNLILWGLGSLGQRYFEAVNPDLEMRNEAAAEWLAIAAYMNMRLLWFNLIPAFPMDGGRVLNALLQFRLPPLKAFWITNQVARIAAVGMAIWAVRIYLDQHFIPYILIFIAWSVFSSAHQTLQVMRERRMM